VLADLAYEGFAQAEIARLEEMRLALLEQRIDADLALGRHGDLVSELEGLIARHPVREHLRLQLMLALYRSERQAEALEAYRAARRELAEELGLEPGEPLKELEQAILRHDPSLDLPVTREVGRPPRRAASPEQAVLIAPSAVDGLDDLLGVARPLAGAEPAHELIAAAVVAAPDLQAATAALDEHRRALLGQGFAVRTAAFSSPDRASDITRLAEQENVDLLVADCEGSALDADLKAVLEQAPCDVALLARMGGPPRDGPVIVPFGAGAHDWGALALGAWFARAAGAPLRLIGTGSVGADGRDASRLLADASLIVQRTAGVTAPWAGRSGHPSAGGGRGAARRGPLRALARGGPRPPPWRAGAEAGRADGLRQARGATRRAGARRDAHPLQVVPHPGRGLARLPAYAAVHPRAYRGA
jgi:8-oxo-dGTP pyrophosphatase MutT (NUDIX family)